MLQMWLYVVNFLRYQQLFRLEEQSQAEVLIFNFKIKPSSSAGLDVIVRPEKVLVG